MLPRLACSAHEPGEAEQGSRSQDTSQRIDGQDDGDVAKASIEQVSEVGAIARDEQIGARGGCRGQDGRVLGRQPLLDRPCHVGRRGLKLDRQASKSLRE